jgi:hypothetical protein
MTSTESLDPIQAANRFRELTRKAELDPDSITPEELREAIDLTAQLRRTNTGPAQTKSSKSKKKGPLSDDQLSDLLKI